ncbi:transmembrane channel-like protein 7 isoform X1 [Synchiropus splendidus]|uniref:transmembrane channel-like protein 7 isoform X1 n=1 Tax=Synchiropus splendidus TaxID=270530 RepID=UPI00237EB80D|nr:transmembrane channel-like protein 7 isoform X1 [Synchiropus splendidus]
MEDCVPEKSEALSDDGSPVTWPSECDYYNTEIYDLLPSSQAGQSELSSHDGPDGHSSRQPREKTSQQPLKNLPVCLQRKREIRDRRTQNIDAWESWKSSKGRRRWAQMRGVLKSLLPWQQMLHTIEGRFGVGVKAYFVFLRYLVYLNMLNCALVWTFILGPTVYYGRSNNSEALVFGSNDSFLDFFLGSGFLARSPLYFDYYTRGALDSPCVNTPQLYVAGILSILLISLIMAVRRTAVGYKHNWILGSQYRMNVSFRIFCGWDFNIKEPDSAERKHSFIRNGLKLLLLEQSFHFSISQRTLGRRVCIHFLRSLLNIIVLLLLAGSFYLIYKAIEISKKKGLEDQYWFVRLPFQYLPPITITSVNLILPLIFRKIAAFEEYSFTTQVNVTLVRSIVLKLTSLGIYLYFVITGSPQHREDHFGQEMYKLCVFSFLTTVCKAFLLSFPKKLMVEKYPSSCLARMLGEQYFEIPFNVLDLVYAQTVSWVGVYFCPLLPLISTFTLMLTIYVKKFTVLRCCVAEKRLFRASNSSVLFHFMLLLGVLMAATTLIFNFHLQESNNATARGPFRTGETLFSVANVCVTSLPTHAQSAIYYFSSQAFALPLLLIEIMILIWFVSLGRNNRRAIESLKNVLASSSSDKRFLVNKNMTTFKEEKKPRPRKRSKSKISDANLDQTLQSVERL